MNNQDFTKWTTNCKLAVKEHDSLLKLLDSHSNEAAKSLAEANMETLSVVKLEFPDLLRKSLLSTKPSDVENFLY